LKLLQLGDGENTGGGAAWRRAWRSIAVFRSGVARARGARTELSPRAAACGDFLAPGRRGRRGIVRIVYPCDNTTLTRTGAAAILHSRAGPMLDPCRTPPARALCARREGLLAPHYRFHW